jgi:co-chaperonin GroES (HSP10)
MVRAILDRVFIRLDKKETATKGGIFLPETVDAERNIGVVEGIGDDVKADIKIGDRVLFHPFDELPTYDPDVVVVRESSLLGVIEDE